MHGRRLVLFLYSSLQSDEPSQAEVNTYVECELANDEDFALQLDIDTSSK